MTTKLFSGHPISLRRGSRYLRAGSLLVSALIGSLIIAFVAYAVVTKPRIAPDRSPLTAFDPEIAGRLEQQAWAAYYYHQ